MHFPAVALFIRRWIFRIVFRRFRGLLACSEIPPSITVIVVSEELHLDGVHLLLVRHVLIGSLARDLFIPLVDPIDGGELLEILVDVVSELGLIGPQRPVLPWLEVKR